MSHFEVGEWADMVRGLTTAAMSARMSEHLASGCRSCRSTADILGRFARFALGEARNEVPSYAEQSARAIFALQRPERVYVFPRIIGRLIYDSFKEPLPAGLRARHRIARHALYQAGAHSLDIRMEHQQGTEQVTLVGQLINRLRPDVPAALFLVFLLSGKHIVAHTTSNALGEFQLAYAPARRLRLYLQGNHDLKRPIEVPLQHFAQAESRAERTRPDTAKKKT